MFITLTCSGYGKVGEDGTPVDPDSYDYQRAARDALHFAALFDRFIQNLRRVLGYDVQYFATIEPQKAPGPARAHRYPRHRLPRRAAADHRRQLPPSVVALNRYRAFRR